MITYHNDNARTGQYTQESTLTQANVASATFGLQRTLPVDGKLDAQPLVLVGYSIGGASHDVVYAATEHDSVYAFDAATGTALWTVSLLGAGETPSDARGCDQVVPEIGVTATPVIDRAAGKIFVVAMSRDAAGGYHQRLHALNLATGAESAGSPVAITASLASAGPAPQNGTLTFDPGQYKERSALLLSGGVIYTSWASHCDDPPYSAWMLAYTENLQQSAVFNAQPNWPQGQDPGEGAFWNSNSGPSADSAGNIYAMNGNGNFDVALNAQRFPQYADYGNAILKLSTPASGTLSVLDYFTMFNTVDESNGDVDLGSGGLLLLPDQTDATGAARHLAVGAGKDSNIYVVDRDNLGKFNAADNSNAYQFIANAFPASSQACGAIVGEFGAPVYFNGTVYFAAAGDVIRAFRLSAARLVPTPSGQTSQAFCYPGATLAISANGTANAILWAVENTGVLHAFNAGNLAVELYNSTQAGGRDQFGPGSKFTPPTVANGRVYVGTQADSTAGGRNLVAVFGLL